MTRALWLSLVAFTLSTYTAAGQAQRAVDTTVRFTVTDQSSGTSSDRLRVWQEREFLVIRGTDYRLRGRGLKARVNRGAGRIRLWITDAPPIVTLKGLSRTDWIPVRYEAWVPGLPAGSYLCEVVREIEASDELTIATDTVTIGS